MNDLDWDWIRFYRDFRTFQNQIPGAFHSRSNIGLIPGAFSTGTKGPAAIRIPLRERGISEQLAISEAIKPECYLQYHIEGLNPPYFRSQALWKLIFYFYLLRIQEQFRPLDFLISIGNFGWRSVGYFGLQNAPEWRTSSPSLDKILRSEPEYTRMKDFYWFGWKKIRPPEWRTINEEFT